MDSSRFDEFTKIAAFGSSRRRIIKTVLGMGVAGLLGKSTLDETAAATLRPAGATCRKPGDCASGVCGPRDSTGRQRCSCVVVADCGGSGICTGGVCVPCPTCYVPSAGGTCVRVMEPMNGRCPCGFEETNGECIKNSCRDCFENVGGICVPEAPGTAPNGICQCGFESVGGICVPRYPLP
jgi:hypothetical protein